MTGSPSLDGYFKSLTKEWSFIKISGDNMAYHEAGRDTFDMITLKLGEFDPTEDKVRELTKKKNYNMKMLIIWDKSNPENTMNKLGVISDDRERLYLNNSVDLSKMDVYERITEEEAEEIEKSGLESISAPPGPYKLQPDKQGKLIWISGPPGAGKSTSAQLLGRLHGFVYYEVDCFIRLR